MARVARRGVSVGLMLAALTGCPGDDPSPAVEASDSGSSGDAGSTTGAAVDETTAGSDPASGGTSSASDDAPPGPHTLGGVLEGLQGRSVAIRSGDDVLVLAADGPFAFPTAVPDGEAYAIGVEAQPSGPEQVCTVSGAAGVVAGADVEDVVVRCVTPIRHVVVLGIDGFGGQWWGDPVATPNLDALRELGVWTVEMQNALPTSSSTNWMSMIGGSTPEQHGVLSNGWQPGDSDPPPTMFATLREHQPDATIGIFHDWADFDRLVEPGVADHVEHPGDEQETMDAATAWLSLQNPHQLYLTAITRAAAFDIAAADCYGDIVADRDRAGIPIGSADAQIAAGGRELGGAVGLAARRAASGQTIAVVAGPAGQGLERARVAKLRGVRAAANDPRARAVVGGRAGRGVLFPAGMAVETGARGPGPLSGRPGLARAAVVLARSADGAGRGGRGVPAVRAAVLVVLCARVRG